MSLTSFFLAATMFFAATSSFGTTPKNVKHLAVDQIPILYKPDSFELPDTPRSPVYNPFYAFQDDCSVILGCLSPYGDVSVALESSAGDDYYTVFDTEDGQIIIPISGMIGHYTLTIVCAGGIVFGGEFDI